MSKDHKGRNQPSKPSAQKAGAAGPAPSIKALLMSFDGIDEAELEDAEPDESGDGILPAAISVGLTPDATGFHMLEFLAWAVSDMESAGASVHLHLESPPPWLNEPGRSLVASIYVNPRTDECSLEQALDEVRDEIDEMTAFLQETYEEYWPQCRPKV